MQTRGLPMRNRRDANGKLGGSNTIILDDDFVANDDDDDEIAPLVGVQGQRKSNFRKQRDTALVTVNNATNSKNDTQRSRRDVPGCIVNYNAQRQLLIGCSQQNVIEVRPQCNEDGDEGIKLFYFLIIF